MTGESLTTAEVATRLGISNTSVRRLILWGELPAHKDGRAFAVPPEAVDALLRRWGVAQIGESSARAGTNPDASVRG